MMCFYPHLVRQFCYNLTNSNNLSVLTSYVKGKKITITCVLPSNLFHLPNEGWELYLVSRESLNNIALK